MEWEGLQLEIKSSMSSKANVVELQAFTCWRVWGRGKGIERGLIVLDLVSKEEGGC